MLLERKCSQWNHSAYAANLGFRVCYVRRIAIWGSSAGKDYLLSHLEGMGVNGSVICERGMEVLERTIHELNAAMCFDTFLQ